MFNRSLRFGTVGAVLATLTLGTACKKDEVPVEPQVATMRLTVGGSQTVDVADDGTVTGGPIVISGNATITAAWLRANGSPETLVTAAEFELRAPPANTGFVTFTRTGAFAGTLNKVAAGSTTIAFSLFHLQEMHDDFGPRNVSITVN